MDMIGAPLTPNGVAAITNTDAPFDPGFRHCCSEPSARLLIRFVGFRCCLARVRPEIEPVRDTEIDEILALVPIRLT